MSQIPFYLQPTTDTMPTGNDIFSVGQLQDPTIGINYSAPQLQTVWEQVSNSFTKVSGSIGETFSSALDVASMPFDYAKENFTSALWSSLKAAGILLFGSIALIATAIYFGLKG